MFRAHPCERNPYVLYQKLANIAQPRLKRKLGAWHLLSFNQNRNAATLRFLVRPDGQAAGTIRHHPDGTVSHTRADGAQIPVFNDFHQQEYQAQQRRAARQLTEIALNHPELREIIYRSFLLSSSATALAADLNLVAQQTVQANVANSTLPSGPRNLKIKDLPSVARSVIRHKITVKETAKAARSAGQPLNSIDDYNQAVLKHALANRPEGASPRRRQPRQLQTPAPPPLPETTPPAPAPEPFFDQHLSRKAAARIGKWQPMTLTSNRRSQTVSILKPDKGPPLHSVTRHSNSTLSCRELGKNHNHHHHMPLYHRHNLNPFHTWVKSQVVRTLHQCAGTPALGAMILDHPERLQMLVSRTADQILNSQHTPPSSAENGAPTFLDVLNRSQQSADQVIDPHVQAMKRYFHAATDTKTYNTVALNKTVFEKMYQSAPNLVGFYCTNIAAADPEPVSLSHPAQVINRLKECIHLTPAQWRYLCRIKPNYILPSNREESLQRIKLACQALVEANRPKTPDKILNAIFHCHNEHNFFRNATWRHGDPWKAWIQLVNQFLAASNPAATNIAPLKYAADALRGHIEQGLPWGKGSWTILQQRAQRWHQQLQEQLQREQNSPQQNASWPSLVGPGKINGLALRPISNTTELNQASRAMANCLHAYVERCWLNQSQIFTVHRDDQILAAIELTKNLGQWTLSQVEAPRGQQLDEAVAPAIVHLQELYRQAHLNDAQPTRAASTTPDQDANRQANRQVPENHAP